jgi:hypothetical protein
MDSANVQHTQKVLEEHSKLILQNRNRLRIDSERRTQVGWAQNACMQHTQNRLKLNANALRMTEHSTRSAQNRYQALS